MSKRVVFALVLVAATASALALREGEGETTETLIEPSLRMVDHSPPVGRIPHAPSRAPSAGVARPAPRGAGFSGNIESDFEESVRFGVNTRNEFGNSRAPMFCECRVLAGLFEDNAPAFEEAEEDDEEEHPMTRNMPSHGRRSYTVPELREKVPLVTFESAQENDEISFGVNVRGEDGPQFNPTWCTCHVLRTEPQQVPGRRLGNGEEEEEEDEDEEQDEEAAANPHGAVGGRRGVPPSPARGRQLPGRRPMPQTNIELDEGDNKAQAEDAAVVGDAAPAPAPAVAVGDDAVRDVTVVNVATTDSEQHEQRVEHVAQEKQEVQAEQQEAHELKEPSPAQLAQSTLNLELGEGATLKGGAGMRLSPNPRHRHSWSVGFDVVPPSAHARDAPERDTEYVFHGHRFSGAGQRLDTPSANTLMLAELDEGRAAPNSLPEVVDNDNDSDNNDAPSPLAEPSDGEDDKPTVVAAVLAVAPNATMLAHRNASLSTVNVSAPEVPAVPSPTPSSAPSPSSSPSPSASASAPEEDSEDEDVVTALRRLASSHPHASATLSKALQAAAQQQQQEVSQLKKALSMKDGVIRKLMEDEEKMKIAFQHEAQEVDRLETLRRMTQSPSATPSRSPTPSPLPSPSPSPSPVIPVAHPAPVQLVAVIDKKGCYHQCTNEECSPLFDQSLRQYASCMDACANRCYNM